MSKFKRILTLVFVFYTLYAIRYTLYADTIRMNDGKELKGIVVEDYKDRIILSTPDGETTVMKEDVRELYFDAEEDNLIKLAEQARDRRDYTRAFAYYDMAFRRNPNSKAAKDGLIFLQGYLFRQEQAKKESEVKKQEDLERYGSSLLAETKSGEEELADMADRMKKTIGITLEMRGSFPGVAVVQSPSPASEAGIQKGDLIIAIWGRLTGYMSLKDVMGIFLEKPSLEIKCDIERTAAVEVNPMRLFESSPEGLIGASFRMETDGLTVSVVEKSGYASLAGLKSGDLITAIDGKSTRYMPLNKAVENIKNTKSKDVKITFRREVLIWRKD